MINNKYKFFFYTVWGLGFVLWFGVFNHSKAQVITKNEPVGSLVLNYEDQSFVASERLISSWKKPTIIRQAPSVKTVSQPSLNNLVENFLSKKTEPQSPITYSYSLSKIYTWVKAIAPAVEIAAKEPSITISEGKAKNFTPPTVGKSIDYPSTVRDIIDAIEKDNLNISLKIITTLPQTSLEETNNIGINELLARGESKFNGSPFNRRHNIEIGVEKIRGVIVKPNEEFSFNKYLGPVEAEQGFLPELVIKRDKGTILELGGGLCQVSSTTFRAAMKAGLPITERRNHAYAVQYYAPQGTDATIYPGIVDLKFSNDTPASILIWPYFKDKNTLIFDFYGTKDNRIVDVQTPVQYDRKPDGSMKATWSRTIEKNGGKTTDTFKSVYLPPALFHKEEKFVTGNEKPPVTESPFPEPTSNQNSNPG